MFKVEKNVAIPPQVAGRGCSKYPFREMKVGDSFFVPSESQEMSAKITSTLHGVASNIFGKGGITTRRVEEKGQLGVRVWRVK